MPKAMFIIIRRLLSDLSFVACEEHPFFRQSFAVIKQIENKSIKTLMSPPMELSLARNKKM